MLLLAHCFLKAFSDFSIIVCHFSVIRLTILSSLAQDESRNISENCKWGIRSKFKEGISRTGGEFKHIDTSVSPETASKRLRQEFKRENDMLLRKSREHRKYYKG